jgi:hypothetical protein
MNGPFFLGLPTSADLGAAPERAIIAALDANLILAVRVLDVLHPRPDDGDFTEDPLVLLANSVRACATSLHTILVAYDDLARRVADQDRP